MNEFGKRTVALGLSAVMLTASASIAFAASGDTASCQKYESVYARLGADGSAGTAYIINHFSVDGAGKLTDYGNYQNVLNLTDLNSIANSGGSTSLDLEKGEFYYQGQIDDVELPWLFTITYELNGKTVTPEELAGKSGALTIHFQSKQNPKVDSVFYENYVMQVSLTLNSDHAKHISAAGATLADAGGDRQLTFTALPGKDADFTIQADVTDFSMSGFSIAAVPYAVDIDLSDYDTGDLTGQFDPLIDAAGQLSNGTADLKNGLNQLQGGNKELQNGSNQIQDGLNQLSGNSSQLLDGSAQIQDGLNQIAQQLGEADFSGLSELGQLPDGLNQMADVLETSIDIRAVAIGKSLRQIADSLSALTETDVVGQMQQLTDGLSEMANSYGEFDAGLQAYTGGVDALAQNYGSFNSGLSGYLNGVKQVNSGVGSLSSGMKEFADGIATIPGEMQNGIDDMMAQYASSDFTPVSFADSRNENIASVQFVISCDGVDEPAKEDAPAEETQTTFWDRLAALFTPIIEFFTGKKDS